MFFSAEDIKDDYEELQYFEVDDDIEEKNDDSDQEEAMFVQSRRGKLILQYKGHRYRKTYSSKAGDKWICSVKNNCGAFVCLNSDDEIVMSHMKHEHPRPAKVDTVDANQEDKAVVITSRKGKDMLLFRQYTYRKQYIKRGRARWVCSNLKNCRAVIFTDSDNFITSAFEDHCHPPPKYYLKADNIIGALKEPLVTDD